MAALTTVADRLQAAKNKPRSVSQIGQYNKCAYSYKLQRIERVWQRPAAWLGQGTAVHAALEAWTRSGGTMTLEEAQAVFTAEFDKEINEACAITPNFDWWSRSGPYAGQADTERRYLIGLEQVEKALGYLESHPWEEIWTTPDGKPAIELEFEITLDCDGGKPIVVRGFIDSVAKIWLEDKPSLRVRDYKTGNNPGDDFQLAVYALAIWKLFGVKIHEGDYFMAGKKGRPAKPTYPYDLSDWTEEAITAKFREVEDKIEAEVYEPDPEPDKCKFCDVSYSCEFRAD